MKCKLRICLIVAIICLQQLSLSNIFAQQNNILFVDDDGGDSYENEYLNRLNKYSLQYSSWSVQISGLLESDILKKYNIVIWQTGWQSLASSREPILQSYLDSGGKLFISGQQIVYSDNSFRNNYLHAKWHSYYSSSIPVKGNDEHQISRGLNFETGTWGNSVSIYNDGIPLFYVFGSTVQVVGLCYEGSYKVVLLNFNLAYWSIPSQIKDEIFYRTIKWLGYYRVKISGNITDKNGFPLSGVSVKIYGNGFGSTLVDANGLFSITDLVDGYYTIVPEKEGYKFTPSSRTTAFLTGNTTGQDFVGELVTETKFKITNNLFNPNKGERVKILYEIPTTGEGSLKIYTVNYELVKTFLSGNILAGSYEFYWDGRNDSNEPVASGLYFLHLQVQGQNINETKKVILVK